MARSRYQITLGQFASLVYWCALYFAMLLPFLDSLASFLFECLVIISIGLFFGLRFTRSRLSRSPVPQDPCGPIVWRGLDDLSPGRDSGGHETWRSHHRHTNPEN